VWPDLQLQEARAVGGTDTPTADAVRVVGDRVSAAVVTWRDREVIRRELRQHVVQRDKRIVSVTGRRGIGKSAVVAMVLAEFEQPDPKRSPLDDVDGLVYLSTRTGSGAITLARVFGAVASLASPEDATRLDRRWDVGGAAALPALWETLRHRRIVIVLDNLDDLQDPVTGRLLSDDLVTLLESVGRTPYPPVVVTTSLRRPVLPPELQGHVEELELTDGLPVGDALEVLRAMDAGTGALDAISDEQLSAAAERIYCIPRGLELLGQVMVDDPFFLDDLLTSTETPDTLMADLVSRGFTRLGGPARLVVGLLALAGVPLPERELPGLLAGLVEDKEVRDVVRSLVRSHELGYEPATKLVRLHPLDADYVRHVLLDDDAATQVDLDLRLAGWYAARQTAPTSWRVIADVTPNRRQFDHRWRGGDHSGAMGVLADAALFLARKGETAMLRAAAAAADGVVTGPAIIDLERCRFSAEFFDGSLDVADTSLRRMRTVAEAAGRLDLLPAIDLDMATVLRHRGDAQATLDLLARIQPPPGGALDDAVALEVVFQEGLSRCYLGDWKGAMESAEQLEAMLAADAPPELLGRPADIRSLAMLVGGDYRGAMDAAADSIAFYLDSPVADSAGYLYNVRGLALLCSDALDEAADELRRGADMAVDYGQDRLEGMCRVNLAWAAMRLGRWDDAEVAAVVGSQRLESNGVRSAATGAALGALLAARRSAPQTTADIERALDAAVAGSARNTDMYQPPQAVVAAIAAALD
jgi:hypothetical protein